MLLTYEQSPPPISHLIESWTTTFLTRLALDPTPSGKTRQLTGHFSFDFIHSEKNGELYPIECNARVHTAIVLLPLDGIAGCYDDTTPMGTETDLVAGIGEEPGIGKELDREIRDQRILRPERGALPRSWIYNDLITRYLPSILPSPRILAMIHPSLPACLPDPRRPTLPSESVLIPRIDPTLVADDWVPFLVFWHVYWPYLLLGGWWRGKRWTRVSAFVDPLMSREEREKWDGEGGDKGPIDVKN